MGDSILVLVSAKFGIHLAGEKNLVAEMLTVSLVVYVLIIYGKCSKSLNTFLSVPFSGL